MKLLMEQSKSAKWDERYLHNQYAYGEKENAFLRATCHYLPKGRILSLGEGEGRNSLYLAKLGYEVTAIDFSKIGLEKTRKRAAQNKVFIRTHYTDLTEYNFGQEEWAGIISIFFHTHKTDRQRILYKCVQALSKNGVFIMEGYSLDQPKFGTGGPKIPEFLCDLEEVKQELAGLNFEIARKVEREIIEGNYHTGMGSVIQIVASKY